MYIDSLNLTNVRTFVKNELRFIHPDSEFRGRAADAAEKGKWPLPKPKLPNVNLLLGDNGSGKSTVLQAVALAAFGPVAPQAQIAPRNLVRLEAPDKPQRRKPGAGAVGSVAAKFVMHEQDKASEDEIESCLELQRLKELETINYTGLAYNEWGHVYESSSALFMAAYGATRRTEPGESLDMGARLKSRFLRALRVLSVFQDSYSLVPLSYWLPRCRDRNPRVYEQVREALDGLLRPTGCTFSGEMDQGDFLFDCRGVRIPFQRLSDGYRAFIGWVADLLFHMTWNGEGEIAIPDTRGVVLVDEIDLHLHPQWQMQVIKTVATALPRMQFIFTSHSPLIAGSLEWMNIITLKTSRKTNRTVSKRLRQSIHGLDADQVLLTDFFGLKTTRADGKKTKLDNLRKQARSGDREAARKMILAMAQGTEEDEA